MRQRESLLDVIGHLVHKRKLWLGFTAIVFVLSLLVSLLLPVYYTATTSFLAASPDQNNHSKLFTGEKVEMYGTGNDIERIIASVESEETIGFLVDSFNLFDVYDIDSTANRAASEVRDELRDHFTVTRTKYSEIEISVEEKDPVRAAAMANAARDRAEDVVRRTARRGQEEMYTIYSESAKTKKAKQQIIIDSLKVLAQTYGIIDVGSQARDLSGLLGKVNRGVVADSARLVELLRQNVSGRLRDTLSLLQAQIEANRSIRAIITGELDRFSTGSGWVQSLNTEYYILNEQLAFDQERRRQLETIIANPGPVIYVTDRARVPDRKSRPVRWLIVVGSTLAAFLFGALGIILWDTYNKIEWQRYLRD